MKKNLEIIQKEFELNDINQVITLLLWVAEQYYYEYGSSWQHDIFERDIKTDELYKKYIPDEK